jgi:hypothetical protein
VATADSDQTGPDTDDAIVPVTTTPEITVVKEVFANGIWVDANTLAEAPSFPERSNVMFRYTVTNTGNVTLSPVTLTDDTFATSGCTIPTSLAPAGTFSCTLTQYFADPVNHVNIATATGTWSGAISQDTDPAHVVITDVPPTVQVDKSANPTTVPLTGGTVTYTVVVWNTSAEPVTLTSLIDDQFGDLDGVGSCSVPQSLAASSGGPGGADTYTCTFTWTLPAVVVEDPYMDIPVHINVVTGTVEDNDGTEADDDGTATVTYAWDGLTPGYWKNHTSRRDGWPAYTLDGIAITPSTLVTAVFDIPDGLMGCTVTVKRVSTFVSTCLDLNEDGKNDTLLDALNYQGGEDLEGKAEILLRAATAGLLNEIKFEDTYPPYSSPEAFVAAVNATLATESEQAYVSMGKMLDGWNNS